MEDQWENRIRFSFWYGRANIRQQGEINGAQLKRSTIDVKQMKKKNKKGKSLIRRSGTHPKRFSNSWHPNRFWKRLLTIWHVARVNSIPGKYKGIKENVGLPRKRCQLSGSQEIDSKLVNDQVKVPNVLKIESGHSKHLRNWMGLKAWLTRKHCSRIHMCFCHRMSVLGERSPSEQIWTGFQWWPPNVPSREAGTRGSQGAEEAGAGGCTVKSNASWVMVIWGPSPLWTDRHTRVKTLPFRNFVGGL